MLLCLWKNVTGNIWKIHNLYSVIVIFILCKFMFYLNYFYFSNYCPIFGFMFYFWKTIHFITIKFIVYQKYNINWEKKSRQILFIRENSRSIIFTSVKEAMKFWIEMELMATSKQCKKCVSVWKSNVLKLNF